jgi:metal transporter CNNM
MQTLNLIFKSGYSRFPVYENGRDDVVGLLLAKDLLFLDPEDELPVRSVMSLFRRQIQSVWPDDRLHEVSFELSHEMQH